MVEALTLQGVAQQLPLVSEVAPQKGAEFKSITDLTAQAEDEVCKLSTRLGVYVSEMLFHDFQNMKVLLCLLSNGRLVLYEKFKLECQEKLKYKIVQSRHLIVPRCTQPTKRMLIPTENNSILVLHPTEPFYISESHAKLQFHRFMKEP